MKSPAARRGGRVKERDRSLPQVYAPADALRFVQAIHADREATYLTLPEAPGGGGGPQLFHGALAEGLPDVEAANRAGHGIFIMVNEGDGRGRATKNVTRVRALFVDLDGAPLPESVIPAPHIVVETSPGRYHLYWVVEDVPLERFSELQIALAALFDGDPAVSDLPRVMRVPGFYHLKREPFRSRLARLEDRPAYVLDEMVDGMFGLAEKLEERHQTPRVTMMPRTPRERERLRRYAAAAFAGEVEAMRLTPDGMRHYRLPRIARKLGQFVASGALSAEAVGTGLREAALAAGMTDRRFIARAIAWGLRVGAEQPRGLPFEEIEFDFSALRSSR